VLNTSGSKNNNESIPLNGLSGYKSFNVAYSCARIDSVDEIP
jgi:hypothetical protein